MNHETTKPYIKLVWALNEAIKCAVHENQPSVSPYLLIDALAEAMGARWAEGATVQVWCPEEPVTSGPSRAGGPVGPAGGAVEPVGAGLKLVEPSGTLWSPMKPGGAPRGAGRGAAQCRLGAVVPSGTK
jgi:hypothetical protein